MAQKSNQRFDRRDLIKGSVAAAACWGLGVAPAFGDSKGGSDVVRLGVIGTGWRGGQLIDAFSKASGVKIVAVCDADESRVGEQAEKLNKSGKDKVDTVTDYRKILERDDIDAVAIAAPNHWHSLMAIEACQAGKHVYCEKPVCHSMWEGRKMVEAMHKYDRIVAAGFQNRSDTGLMKAIPMIHSGKFGAIQQIRGLCYRGRNSIGKLETPLTPPKSVDYNLWLGPAADQAIMRPKFHYDWHWDFNTGNGDMGNQGPHELDLIRWALGDPTHPAKVMSFGGRFGWDDAGNTPNMQCSVFDYGDGIPVIFEVRNLYQKENHGVGRFRYGPFVGIHVTCENGSYRGGRGGGAFYDKRGQKLEEIKGDSGMGHQQNFVDAIRTNDPGSLRSPIESGYYSSCMSHLAGIAVRTGQETPDKEIAERLSDNALAAEVYDRFSKQLQLWEVDTKKTPWRMGPTLTFDNAKEQFTAGDNLTAANGLLRREDRSPFVVPESV
ncbi:Gfo/Idh/MocA family protein [Bremerella sp. T1]|uniref:Gfo/Idh/MocA family protein n=1 Tax=Bremerella sp. TYQ1 TaxID=3119568 RepID=UPI001CCEC38B|nr:Gfo/Idh/MocA family oxidoreductase [Bremerella volcania]UBM35228.1 Gfo/Idh/MocA family oxidoreductase [Bremerella volcania]